MRIITKTIGVILLIAGLIAFLLPDIYTIWFQVENDSVIQEFKENYYSDQDKAELNSAQSESTASTEADKDEETEEVSQEPETENSPVYDDLYVRCKEYNQNIYETKQEEMVDPWSVAAVPSELEIEDDVFGYLEIPAMDVEMALYVGATNHNMAHGAAILSQTSMPIGGENTNCVIAGHRGYQGIPYFREIEKLQLGDLIYITNPWETLTYEVTEIKIIDPDASDQILIQDGKDMVTLLTCHPYRSHGKYRYVVYCERTYITEEGKTVEDIKPEEIENEDRPLSEVIIESDVEFVSSEPDIIIETVLRVGGAIIILILLFLVLKPSKRIKKRKKY